MRPLTLASLALPASAFLIPPEVSAEESDVVNALPVEPIAGDFSFAQTVKLDCPGCPVRVHNAYTATVTTELSSHLELDISIQNSDGQDRLLVNGFELYPHADPFRAPLIALHVVDGMPDSSNGHHMMADMTSEDTIDILGFSLQSKTLARDNDNEPMELVGLEFQILEVGNIFVNGIPGLQIQVVKMMDSGHLAIVGIEETESQAVPVITDGADVSTTDCDSFLCKWIQSLENHWNHWRPHCGAGWRKPHGHHNGPHHGRPGHHGKPHHGKPHHSKPHHNKPHHGHHGGQEDGQRVGYEGNQRTWSQLMHSITAHIIVPVFVGIFAGVAVSMIGMAIGTSIIFLYRTFIRPRRSHLHHRRRRHSKAPKEAVTIVHEEKQSLLDNQEHQDPPPSYDEDVEDQKANV